MQFTNPSILKEKHGNRWLRKYPEVPIKYFIYYDLYKEAQTNKINTHSNNEA